MISQKAICSWLVVTLSVFTAVARADYYDGLNTFDSSQFRETSKYGKPQLEHGNAQLKQQFKVSFEREALALHIAAKTGKTDVVKQLIDAGVDVDARDPDGWTALMYSVAGHQMETLRTLLKLGADPDAKSKRKLTAVHLAITQKSQGALSLLQEFGANLTSADDEGIAPIHLAVLSDEIELTKNLIAAGADINQKTQKGITPLMIAAQRQSPRLVSLLISGGADPNASLADGTTASMIAVNSESGPDIRLIEALLKGGADIFAKNKEGFSARALAVVHNHIEAAQYLKSVAPNGQSTVEKSPPSYLVGAIAKGLNKVALRLIKSGEFELNGRDKNGWTPMAMASYMANLNLVKSLYQAGASLTSLNRDHMTPLHLAAAALLNKTLWDNPLETNKQKAWKIAATVKWLTRNGGANFGQDAAGRTPFDIAIKSYLPEDRFELAEYVYWQIYEQLPEGAKTYVPWKRVRLIEFLGLLKKTRLSYLIDKKEIDNMKASDWQNYLDGYLKAQNYRPSYNLKEKFFGKKSYPYKNLIIGIFYLRRDPSAYPGNPYADCMKSDEPDRVIIGCTTELQNGDGYSPTYRAMLIRSRAYAYFKKGHYRRVIADLNEVIEIGPPKDSVFYTRGLAFARTGNRRGAISDFRKVLSLNPKHLKALEKLVQMGILP